jgi:hypothetical protein
MEKPLRKKDSKTNCVSITKRHWPPGQWRFFYYQFFLTGAPAANSKKCCYLKC